MKVLLDDDAGPLHAFECDEQTSPALCHEDRFPVLTFRLSALGAGEYADPSLRLTPTLSDTSW